MRVAVAGANGSTGRALVDRALSAGHQVTALVRRSDGLPEHPGLRIGLLDVTSDHDRAAALLEGHDAVISTLGNALFYRSGPAPKFLAAAHRTLVAAAQRAGVPRVATMLAYGSAATTAPAPPIIRLLAGTLLRRDFRDLAGADAALAESGLAWTVVHFGALTDGEHTGAWQLSTDLRRPARYRIARADVADALLTVVSRPGYEQRRAVVSGAPR
ncbi:Putative NADH-flavin reductase [Actinoplanes philippinensis]|uniref:Putative NADH-flavin reductase n=2 Tax=Actinoplanes philippinensis TaxID=35752 RepID=A0A1I2G0P5_9ACTN|nr:Putative NADH-flavin reductase [Actinoplanes philippinensis]